MTENRLVILIAQRAYGELSLEEDSELEAWAGEAAINKEFLNRMLNKGFLEKEMSIWRGFTPARGHFRWKAYRRSRVRKRFVWAMAACILAAVTTGGLIQLRHSVIGGDVEVLKRSYSVLPGKNTALLTLADGKQILLDSAAKGQLAMQGNVRVLKGDAASLTYMPVTGHAGVAEYNVLTTPRSGQYKLTLPDGTKVWLNNVSSLRYPTSFEGRERTVEVSGEAYFEVSPDALKPFRVKVRDEVIEVLGTSFNIMAYSEEGEMETTLLTGAVVVKTGGREIRLRPEEQLRSQANGEMKILSHVAGEDIVSWKDGFFYFGRASFPAVMRQLARWYDVEVVYEGKEPKVEFGGKIDRNLPLNDLLKFLNKNQIQFQLEGRKLIVLPN